MGRRDVIIRVPERRSQVEENPGDVIIEKWSEKHSAAGWRMKGGVVSRGTQEISGSWNSQANGCPLGSPVSGYNTADTRF